MSAAKAGRALTAETLGASSAAYRMMETGEPRERHGS
jgi:hypothetical protein